MYFKFRYLEILFLLCYRYLHALTLCIDWRDESAHNDNFNYRFFFDSWTADHNRLHERRSIKSNGQYFPSIVHYGVYASHDLAYY